MGNTATPWSVLGCAGAILLTAVAVPRFADDAPPPDRRPRGTVGLHAPDLSPILASARVSDHRQMRPTGRITGAHTAPSGATDPERQALAPQKAFVIALGEHAKSMSDPAFRSGFDGRTVDLQVSFTDGNERDAIELRMVNRVDMTLIGGSLSKRDLGAGLRQTQIGLELYALAVAADFPLRSLSRTQMRQLLTGEVRDWQQMGCDRGKITVIVPSQNGLAKRATRELILGDKFTSKAVRAADEKAVSDHVLRDPGAIAVVRVKGEAPAGTKLLQIDWTPPTAAAFGYGTYPYGVPLQVVTSGQPDEHVARFIDYATSDDGRELLGRTLLLR